IGEQRVSHSIGGFGQVKLADPPGVMPSLSPLGQAPLPAGEIPEVAIKPGQTIALTLRVDRRKNNGVLSFGKEDAGRNLPHGVYVDNIGLNGVLLLAGQNEREVFITADDWVPTGRRLFFLQLDQEGKPCSWPVTLVVE
ncbi:MAG: hypothetical protein KDA41_20265, partial [Planctomycetales bacterium]|nr:hypothetical protein [Planctomycetales bacterium]